MERKTMRLTFDIETDGLDATKIWCLVIENIDTGMITIDVHISMDLQAGVHILSILNSNLMIGLDSQMR